MPCGRGTEERRNEMKTLEQLGISPAPWHIEKNAGVLCAKSERYKHPIVDDCGNFENNNDKRLIAAAPELYEALRMYQEAFEEIRKSAWFIDANFYEIMNLNKVMTAADAALAKAAGESEVHQ